MLGLARAAAASSSSAVRSACIATRRPTVLPYAVMGRVACRGLLTAAPVHRADPSPSHAHGSGPHSSQVRSYASKAKKGDGKEQAGSPGESKVMAKLRAKLAKKKIDTSASAKLIGDTKAAKIVDVSGVPPLINFIPKIDENKSPNENGLDLMSFLERRQFKRTMEERKYPDVLPGCVIRVDYVDWLTQTPPMYIVGIVLAVRGAGLGRNFTVRSTEVGETFEINFPFADPTIKKIQVLKYQKFRKKKLYFLRKYADRNFSIKKGFQPIIPKDGKPSYFKVPRK